jgi:hypothetical protein
MAILVIMKWNSRKRNLLPGSTKAADLLRDRASWRRRVAALSKQRTVGRTELPPEVSIAGCTWRLVTRR